uniref:Uncharacterized protein n=1 Tax=Magallana gigas TaxID=29159 RepID=A0A8W8KYG6_MAGGI
MKGIYLCFLLWNITTGSNTSCLNCVCAYNEDLSGIRDSQIRLSLFGLISSFCTQAGCRTAGAEDTDLISDCSSNSQSKTPACVVCDGTLTFSSKSAPDEKFTATIIYRGCAEVDSSNVITSCKQYTKTDWTTLPLFQRLSTFQEASSDGFYSGSMRQAMVNIVMYKGKSLFLCSIFWSITPGTSIPCINCVCMYDSDLSQIQAYQDRLALGALINSYCTNKGCRTAGPVDLDLISDCSSNIQSKIPACVECDGILTFSSKSGMT